MYIGILVRDIWSNFFIRLIRHSRFGGTYVVQNMKAIGENQMICHKPYQAIEDLEFGHNKVNKTIKIHFLRFWERVGILPFSFNESHLDLATYSVKKQFFFITEKSEAT